MKKYKTINGYDLETQIMRDYEIGDSPYLGMIINGVHYVVGEEDWKDFTESPTGLAIPTGAYKVVGHNSKKDTTKLERITDPRLLERIALEFFTSEEFNSE